MYQSLGVQSLWDRGQGFKPWVQILCNFPVTAIARSASANERDTGFSGPRLCMCMYDVLYVLYVCMYICTYVPPLNIIIISPLPTSTLFLPLPTIVKHKVCELSISSVQILHRILATFVIRLSNIIKPWHTRVADYLELLRGPLCLYEDPTSRACRAEPLDPS